MTRDFPVATRKDHRTFCVTERWVEVRNTRGKTSHHVTYELTVPDGRILRTRISHPPGKKTYGASLWRHILRDQLEVAEDVFWRCVEDGILPDRGTPELPAERIPAGVVAQLLAHGIPEAEVRDMSRVDAIGRLTRIWGEG